ncbi:hypothetical protein [Helicobacter sp. MIT 01-3238]|uniref:hypothetical protein n=1 Tax=Helicobacter sp. MIT 01-3238 TaxID=398627 RepID=UPI0026A1FBC3
MSEIKTPDNVAQSAEVANGAMDIFEKKLQDELGNLKNCQQSSGVDSCFVCEKMLECPTRKSYVSAVYESMGKGQEGIDFDF